MEQVIWNTLLAHKIVNYPVNVYALAKAMGRLMTYGEAANALGCTLAELTANYQLRDGLTMVKKGNPPLILYNELQPEHRIRFTIAHECAHLIIASSDESVIDQGSSMILMPKQLLEKYRREGHPWQVEGIAAAFQVSKTAARIRMRQVGQPEKHPNETGSIP